jgi:hypothetical protein
MRRRGYRARGLPLQDRQWKSPVQASAPTICWAVRRCLRGLRAEETSRPAGAGEDLAHLQKESRGCALPPTALQNAAEYGDHHAGIVCTDVAGTATESNPFELILRNLEPGEEVPVVEIDNEPL